MTAHSLDTLTIASKLKAAGFSEGQAEAVTLVLRDSREADLSTLSTKSDIAELKASSKSDIAELRAATKSDIAELRAATKSDIAELRASTKADISEVRAELKSEIRQVELRLETKIEASKADTIKWVVSAIGFQTIVIVGAIFALVRVFRP